MEEQLPAGLGEGQVAEFVEDDEVAPGELVRGAALASGADLGLEVVDQVDDVLEAAACALADAGPRDGDGEMGLAGAGAADQHDVALGFEEAAHCEVADQGLVDRRGGEVELGQLPGRRQPGGRHLVLCQSARKFDPPETRDINELARRSAPNIHAEQHTAISPKRMRSVRPSSLQQKCPYDKNDDPSNQPNDIDCCGDAGSTIREHRR